MDQLPVYYPWLFRIVISASMGADLRMLPHESALCTIGCEYISLGSFVRHRHWEGFCTSGAVVCLLLVAPERRSGEYGWPKAIDFYVLSCGSFRKPACNLVETAQRKSQTATRSWCRCC